MVRTTLVPGLSGEQEISIMAAQLKGMGFSGLVLHGFVPGGTLDPDMAEIRPYTLDDMKRLQGAADAVFS